MKELFFRIFFLVDLQYVFFFSGFMPVVEPGRYDTLIKGQTLVKNRKRKFFMGMVKNFVEENLYEGSRHFFQSVLST